MLIILAGLPGAGKSTLAAALASTLRAVHLRIDTIEQAIRDSGVQPVPLDDAGYRVGYALAEDNLRLGHTVIADSVNPWPMTRDAWVSAAKRAGADWREIEIVCSDAREHRRRVETRVADIPGHRLPTWHDVLARDYRPWGRSHAVIDTADMSLEESLAAMLAMVASGRDD
ncbi:MAG TPA: AAA family ATPase [Vicinamibacterales bacterium]|nr:AAA family ATPase [Vicinamibacterales bacterium]